MDLRKKHDRHHLSRNNVTGEGAERDYIRNRARPFDSLLAQKDLTIEGVNGSSQEKFHKQILANLDLTRLVAVCKLDSHD